MIRVLLVQVAFLLAVVFKAVQEALDVRRKQLEIRRERQKLDQGQKT